MILLASVPMFIYILIIMFFLAAFAATRYKG
jgi:hypothetical protein